MIRIIFTNLRKHIVPSLHSNSKKMNVVFSIKLFKNIKARNTRIFSCSKISIMMYCFVVRNTSIILYFIVAFSDTKAYPRHISLDQFCAGGGKKRFVLVSYT